MSKLAKIITFVGVTGAALAGLWYFLDTSKKALKAGEEKKEDCEESKEESVERSYVSLEPEEEKKESDKEALKKVVESAVAENQAKAEEAAEGVGLVKEETQTSDFKFESFDDEEK